MNNNNSTSKVVLAVIATAILALVIGFAAKQDAPAAPLPNDVVLGATSGPDVYNPYFFYNGLLGRLFSQGGSVLTFTATSTQAARTLTQAELAANRSIVVAATNTVALTLTLPATSTLTTLIKTPGDWVDYMILNNHSGAATTTTIAAGTGVTLEKFGTSSAVIGAGKTAYLRLFRKPNTDVTASLLNGQN